MSFGNGFRGEDVTTHAGNYLEETLRVGFKFKLIPMFKLMNGGR